MFGDVFEEREEKNRKFDDERWDAERNRESELVRRDGGIASGEDVLSVIES